MSGLNFRIKVSERDKIKRREEIFDKIIKQTPDNDKYYISCEPTSDSYLIKEDGKRNNDDEEKPKKNKIPNIRNLDILARANRISDIKVFLRTVSENTKRQIMRRSKLDPRMLNKPS